MTYSAARHLICALGVRVLPGAVNFATLIYLGSLLSEAAYGIFSTAIATAAVLSNIAFGWITFSIMGAYAEHEQNGRRTQYLSEIVSLAITVGVGVLFVGLSASALREGIFIIAVLVLATGLHTTFQELLRCQLRIGAYGASSSLQALLYFMLVLLFVDRETGSQTVIELFSWSYAASLIASLLLLQVRKFTLPRIKTVRSIFFGGGYLLAGNLAENALFVGFRYVTGVVNGLEYLGVFSFCVDLAQRSVGFFMNAASFIFVPQAFKVQSAGRRNEFLPLLLRGAKVALICAAMSFTLILIIYHVHPFATVGSPFEVEVFALVTIAVVVNRTRKMLLDPIAIRENETRSIWLSYLLGAAVGVFIGGLLAALPLARWAEVGYLIGYLSASLFAYYLLRHSLESSRRT